MKGFLVTVHGMRSVDNFPGKRLIYTALSPLPLAGEGEGEGAFETETPFCSPSPQPSPVNGGGGKSRERLRFLFIVVFLAGAARGSAEEPAATAVVEKTAETVAASTGVYKTLITGARMNLVNKGEAVEFVGGVKLVRGNDVLSAERMVSEEKKGLTHAWGQVYMSRRVPETGVVWEAWADEAVYDANASSGTLWGQDRPAKTRRTPPPGDPHDRKALSLEGRRITLYPSSAPAVGVSSAPKTLAEVHGRVYLIYSESLPVFRETQVWAGHAFYDGPEGFVKFWGGYSPAQRVQNKGWRFLKGLHKPFSRQREEGEVRDLTGQTITYFTLSRRLVVEKDVKTVITPLKKKPGSKKKE